jgi:hypothetical protein
LPTNISARNFHEQIRRGKEFERSERSQWTDAEHKGIQPEAEIQWQGKRGRMDIRLGEATDECTLIVEIKATDWDKILPHRVRPNVLRHARQIWRYIEAELLKPEVKGVHPALVYMAEPKTPGRKEEIETVLNERGIQVVWRA